MMIEQRVEIDAPVNVVWEVYSDVVRWPEWAASVRSLTYVLGAGVEVGARVRIDQPRLPVTVWEVTKVNPGRSWTWVARGPGATTTGVHEVRALDGERTEVVNRVIHAGPLGLLVGRLAAGLTRRYLAMEAHGLAARSLAVAGDR